MIRAQIIYSRIAAIVREMAATVQRTARSPGLTEGRRYAAALITGEAQLAAQAQFDASHIFLVRDSVATTLDRFAFNLADGDIVAVGDPYSGGSTPQRLTIAAPIFVEGELTLFPAIRAEMADLAGEYPGSLHPFASEIWQEGIRTTPIKLYRYGVLQRDALRFLLRNSRAEAEVRADIEAIVAALRAASASIATLVREKGRKATVEAIDTTIAHSRRLGAAHIESAFGTVDQTVGTTLVIGGNETVDLRLHLEAKDGRLALDFAGTGSNRGGPYNMMPGQAKGYALVAALAEILDGMTLNDGLLQLVEATAPRGSLVDPVLPAATGLSDEVTAHALVRLVRTALTGAEHDEAPRLDGPQPAAIAFLPIGAETNPPLALAPGFSLAAEGWGPPILAGRGILPSAEILEAREGIVVLGREFDAAGSLHATIRNDGPALEGNFHVPRSVDGAEGAIALTIDGERREIERAVAVPIPHAALIEFTYPAYGSLADG